MNTTIISASTFFASLHACKGDRFQEASVIDAYMGEYSVGEPHGIQLDMARYTARVELDMRFSEPEIRSGSVFVELSAAERELLRRWRNFERRAIIARNELRDLDAKLLELSQEGEVPSTDQQKFFES